MPSEKAGPQDDPQMGERQLLHTLLERVAEELMTLRRDIGHYEGVVLTQLAGRSHAIGAELQSIDLSLQTLEEVAQFVQTLAAMTEGDHCLDPASFPMRFKLGDVKSRLFDLGAHPPYRDEPFSVDFF